MSVRSREPTSGWTVLREGWGWEEGTALIPEGLGLIWGEMKGCWDFQVTWQAEGCARAQVCCREGELLWSPGRWVRWCSAQRLCLRVFRDCQPCVASSSAVSCWHCFDFLDVSVAGTRLLRAPGPHRM